MTRDIVYSNPTRRSLLDRLKNPEDNKSWDEFYKIYSGLIFSVALKAGLSTTEAEEALQETCISVAKQMPAFEYNPSKGSFKGWLLHTARWRICDQVEKRDSRLKQPRTNTGTKYRTGTIERIPDPKGFNLDALWDRELKQGIFEAAVERVKRQVKGKQFQIFDSYVLKKWPVGQVARFHHVSSGAVYLAKFRVMRLVRKEVKKLKTQM